MTEPTFEDRRFVEQSFPRLRSCHWEVTSSPDHKYNCLSFVLGDTTQNWWPVSQGGAHWPESIPNEETLEAFVALFRSFGYEECEDGSLEIGLEKVAIFAREGKPKHVSKQLANGHWVSKLAYAVDIQHGRLDGVETEAFGTVVAYLSRPPPI